MSTDEFPAKILLFGEYIILLRPQALVIPFPHFQGILKLPEISSANIDKSIEFSNQILDSYSKYIRRTLKISSLSQRFDLKKFSCDIENGLYFESTIPLNFGLGSSGALTAAVYNQYIIPKDNPLGFRRVLELEKWKKDLALLESFFHSRSSGIDPLVSYINLPLVVSDRGIEQLNFSLDKNGPLSAFLIDTKTVRNTGNLVNQFLNDCKDPQYNELIMNEFQNLNDICINSLINNEIATFFPALLELSKFEFQIFSKMIPDSVKPLWKSGLQSGMFGLKLCGSGGGGYMLGFTLNYNVLKENKYKTNLPILHVDFL